MDWLGLWYGLAVLVLLTVSSVASYAWGRYLQQEFDWRYCMRRQEHLMADFSKLTAEVAKLIAYAQQPKVEDPAIQAEIDRLAGEVKATNDALQPPAP